MFQQGSESYFAGYDGNENVVSLTKASNGKLAAEYEYDAFGNTLRENGEIAQTNPIRFSGKYFDSETNLIYYGFRYYNPQTGRWISKDPSEEFGGINLYGFLNNDSVNGSDFLGLWKKNSEWKGSRGKYSGTVIADGECDTYERLAYLITGNEEDVIVLSEKGNAPKDKVVNIEPLLVKLEERLRLSVVSATGKFQAEFGTTGWLAIPTSSKGATYDIEQFFKPNPAYKPECEAAMKLMFFKGLIDVLRPDEFENIGFLNKPIAEVILQQNPVSPNDMKVGEGGYIANFPDYKKKFPNGAWRGENVIKTGDDEFWGHGVGKRSEAGWKKELKDAYNEAAKRRRYKTRTGEVPGFDGDVLFFNVPSIAEAVFNYRNK